MNAFIEGMVTIALAIIGLGIVSVLVSKNATTAADIQASASGFGNVLGVAEAPVTGASYTPILSYPSNSGYTTGFGS